MTPPLPSRSTTRRLTSPASSPNLCRSSTSAPPTITVDTSVREQNPHRNSSISDTQILPGEGSPNSSPRLQQRVLQLPPINAWNPKCESMFTSILDSRSPQTYRRTASASSSKTASFPVQVNVEPTSRVSWPQRSGVPLFQSSPPLIRPTVESESLNASKSPNLLRKCTSFDIERSKPFPPRALISSPRTLRKVSSSIDSSREEVKHVEDTQTLNKWDTECLSNDSCNISNKEDGDFFHAERFYIPDIESGASASAGSVSKDSRPGVTLEDLVGPSSQTEFEFDSAEINRSLEDPDIPETDILDDIIEEGTNGINEGKGKDFIDSAQGMNKKDKRKGMIIDNEVFNSAPDLGTKPKAKKSLTESFTKHVSKLKHDSSKKSKADSQKIYKSKSGKGKEPEANGSPKSIEKQRSKSTSSVKSALLSSAAKLKAISKKSPVLLLSYKSHSISIPDHSRKPERPFSTSALSSSPRRPGIHQTESSPTVLVTNPGGKVDALELTRKRTQSVSKTVDSDKPKPSNKEAEMPIGKKHGSASETSSAASCKLTEAKTDSKETKHSAAKVVQNLKSTKDVEKSDKSTAKDCNVSSASSVSRTDLSKNTKTKKVDPVRKSAGSKVVPIELKKTNSDSPTSNAKPSSSAQKRDSVSSVNSDTAKKPDHFRDCCQSKRKNTEKK